MTQSEMTRAVVAVTGKTVCTIAQIGSVPLTPTPVEREPLVVDWDELDVLRYLVWSGVVVFSNTTAPSGRSQVSEVVPYDRTTRTRLPQDFSSMA